MDKSAELPDAAGRLSNALRLYAETSLALRATYSRDPEEAIDNLDRAFDGVLTAMHSLYDAMRGSSCAFDWYMHGDTAACIVVRNARHHNIAGLFRSWNDIMLKRGQLKAFAGAEFLLVGYELISGEGMVSQYYIPWDNFREMLSLPIIQSQLKNPSILGDRFDLECGFASIRQYAESNRYPWNQVFVNMIPIMMNAASRVFAALKNGGVAQIGFDYKTFADHFAAAQIVDLQRPTFKTLRAPFQLAQYDPILR